MEDFEKYRSQWAVGPWSNEPDRVEWIDSATNLPCLIVRNRELGHLCGYVGVPSSHPCFGRDYDEVDCEVHGGLTYANECSGEICHKANQEVWWFGFDCAHLFDLSPWMKGRNEHSPHDVYRDIPYVRSECEKLAAELKEKC
jgi:hypothetical protein